MLSLSQQERLARNEAFFRDVNERINDSAQRLTVVSDAHDWEYFCECADPGCLERVSLTREEYEAIRADPTRFVLCPGHAIPEIERVVAIDAERMVVEKDGRAGMVATALDPRG